MFGRGERLLTGACVYCNYLVLCKLMEQPKPSGSPHQERVRWDWNKERLPWLGGLTKREHEFIYELVKFRRELAIGFERSVAEYARLHKGELPDDFERFFQARQRSYGTAWYRLMDLIQDYFKFPDKLWGTTLVYSPDESEGSSKSPDKP